MKTKIYLLAMFGFTVHAVIYGQSPKAPAPEATTPFNSIFWNAYADKLNLTASDRKEFISSHQRQTTINSSFFIKEIQDSSNPSQQRPNPSQNQNGIFAGPCVNIDFENGNLNGWNSSCGFHPLFNPLGCCPNPGGQQTIMTGAGVDPAGGFPIVAPGGNFSLRIGNNATGGQADRIEQTFMVTAANANFNYQYAVVFQDPGHTQTQQPAFQVVMLDSLGVQIPCTFYDVAAGGNIPGFVNSPNLAGVVYKPWSNVIVDLTNYIGQNITIRFSTYDCALGGHYGYAYIDGSCMSFVTGYSDTLCAGASTTFCVPNGFGTYAWSGPGILSNTNSCITASAVGIYTCQTTLVTGCTGPQFTYTLNNYPNPVALFNNQTSNACATQYSFANTSTISSGSISNYNWSVGTGASISNASSFIYNFPAAGNYSVNLIATSNNGCSDTITQTIIIYPLPVASFTAPSTCQTSATNFTNTTTLATGSISSYIWNLGNGDSSSVVNPIYTYTTNGNYQVSLTAISNQGCASTYTSILIINPLPSPSFTNNTVCYGGPISFTNTSFISSGNLINFNWNYGVAGNPNSQQSSQNLSSTNYSYPAVGNYTVSLQAISNFNCRNTFTNIVTVHALPNTLFTAQNVCLGSAASFTNASTVVGGNTISTYSWNFGNQQTSTQTNPQINYSFPNRYTVQLTATSNFNCRSTYTAFVDIYDLPNVNFIAPATCQSSIINFTNTSSIPNGSISSYFWNFGNGDTASLANPSFNYTNSGSFPVSLTATSDHNCVSTTTNIAVINPLPVTSFTNNEVCLGAPMFFSNTSYISSGSINSYTWDYGINTPGTTQPTPNSSNSNYVYPTAGNYVVTLQASSSFNCLNSFTKTVVVHILPSTSFVGENKCLGSISSFTNLTTIAAGNSISTYTWNFGNQQTSTQANPQINYNIANIYTVQLASTSNFNCVSTYTALVTVYNLPNVNFTANNACLNQSTQFNNTTIISGGNIVKWLWDFQNDGIYDDSTLTNPAIVYPNSGLFNVKLKAVSNRQCVASISNSIIVHANPVANFTAESACLGDITHFTNFSTSSDGQIINYLWDFNGDNIVDNVSSNPQHMYSYSSNNLTKLEVQTIYGCTNVKAKSVFVNPKPLVAFSAPSREGCKEACITFTNSSEIANGSIVTNQWQFGDGSYPDYSLNPTHCYKTGNYAVTLKVVSDSGCISTQIQSDYINIHPTPIANFKVEPQEIDELNSSANISTNASGASTTNYYINDGSNLNTESFNYTFKNVPEVTPVIFQVVTNEFGCKDTTSQIIKIKPYWTVYIPNTFTPNNDGLNDGFTAKGYNINKFSIQIYDRWGHQLFESDNIENAWDGRTKGSSEPIKQDTYVWKVQVVDIYNKNHDLTGHVTLLKNE